MKINDALSWATKILNLKQVDSPRLDAEILLAFTLKKPREFLLTHPKKKLTSLEVSKYQRLISCRAHRKPIAYIIGKKEFYGLEFLVNKNVLIPRPETETLVNEILRASPQDDALDHICTIIHDHELLYNRKTTIIDVGTGSGCVAVTIAWNMKQGTWDMEQGMGNRKQGAIKNKKNRRQYQIFATDSSQNALRVAQKNAKLHGVEKSVTFLRGNLLQPVKPHILQLMRSRQLEKIIFVANLPYLTPQEWKKTQPEIRKYEPPSALVGGKDGLKYYRELLRQIRQSIPHPRTISTELCGASLNPPPRWPSGERTEGVRSAICFFEINPRQKNPLQRIIKNYFPGAKTNFIQDLNGSIRVCKIEIFNFNQNKNV